MRERLSVCVSGFWNQRWSTIEAPHAKHMGDGLLIYKRYALAIPSLRMTLVAMLGSAAIPSGLF